MKIKIIFSFLLIKPCEIIAFVSHSVCPKKLSIIGILPSSPSSVLKFPSEPSLKKCKTILESTLSQTSSTKASSTSTKVESLLVKINTNRQKKILGISMSFLTGWIDILLFARFKTFCTMMSGNTIWLGKALVERQWRDSLYYTSMLSCYLLGLIAFQKIKTQNKRFLPICAAIVAPAMFFSNVLLNNTCLKWLAISVMAFAFAIINNVGTTSTGSLTFVITGHMTKFVNQFLDFLNTEKRETVDVSSMLQNVSLVFSFFLGSIVACLKIVSEKYEFMTIGFLFSFAFVWKDYMERKVAFLSDKKKDQEYSSFISNATNEKLLSQIIDEKKAY